ncbi:MAG: integrase core domain-containing protein [Planctomycetota bacterium]
MARRSTCRNAGPWDTLCEARAAIEAYVRCYNEQRIHSALAYQTLSDVAAAFDAGATA